MLNTDVCGRDLLLELVNKLNDYNDHIKGKGSYFYAFNPSTKPDKDMYERNIMLIDTIYEVLNEYNINIKSQGYTFIKDAICIIVDKRCLDVCLTKEIYPLIADKYNVTGKDAVEHSIRNALKAAYSRSVERFSGDGPTNKTFILMAVQEVSARLIKICSYN